MSDFGPMILSYRDNAAQARACPLMHHLAYASLGCPRHDMDYIGSPVKLKDVTGFQHFVCRSTGLSCGNASFQILCQWCTSVRVFASSRLPPNLSMDLY